MADTFRSGALGALLDEYERAVQDLKNTLSDVSETDFVKIVDHETKDPDCVSIQTVMNHTINAGYGYVWHIMKNLKDPDFVRAKAGQPLTPEEASVKLDEMMAYTVDQLSGNFTPDFEETLGKEFEVPWSQTYDFEQIIEHAIVHILRHRRQIEKFKIRLAG